LRPAYVAEPAKRFIKETPDKHQDAAGQASIHADHGKVMTSKPVAFTPNCRKCPAHKKRRREFDLPPP
jgi:peroxiredoxin